MDAELEALPALPDQGLHDGQPQASPAAYAQPHRGAGTRFVHAIKTFENKGQILGGDARPTVLQPQHTPAAIGLHRQFDRAGRWGILDRIVQQVE